MLLSSFKHYLTCLKIYIVLKTKAFFAQLRVPELPLTICIIKCKGYKGYNMGVNRRIGKGYNIGVNRRII
jgi:hypothetical protein